MRRHHHQRMPHPFRRYVSHKLHRKIFIWFGMSILLTGVIASAVMFALSDWSNAGWWKEVQRVEHFVSGRFAEVWDDNTKREAFAQSIAKDLDLGVILSAADGTVLHRYGASNKCRGPQMNVPVMRENVKLGAVELCAERYNRSGPAKGLKAILPLIIACLVLWGASGRIARRLTRPLGDLVRVTKEIGGGKLSARAGIGCQTPDEVGVLAEAINDMASRIERQLNDQRVLLAAVSHELRTPLGHVRILTELARQQGADQKMFDEIEAEVVEIDDLVAELLASSRLDFTALSPQKLDPRDVARRALERAGVDPSVLQVEGAPPPFNADPTLIARALANLVDNAMKHGGGVSRLLVAWREGKLLFAVEDKGPGLRPGDETKVFQPFYRREDGSGSKGSLGLGLSLVRRIAEAHGGTAYAENKEEGGARVSFELLAA